MIFQIIAKKPVLVDGVVVLKNVKENLDSIVECNEAIDRYAKRGFKYFNVTCEKVRNGQYARKTKTMAHTLNNNFACLLDSSWENLYRM